MMQKRVYFVNINKAERASIRVTSPINYAQAKHEGWKRCSLKDYRRMGIKP